MTDTPKAAALKTELDRMAGEKRRGLADARPSTIPVNGTVVSDRGAFCESQEKGVGRTGTGLAAASAALRR